MSEELREKNDFFRNMAREPTKEGRSTSPITRIYSQQDTTIREHGKRTSLITRFFSHIDCQISGDGRDFFQKNETFSGTQPGIFLKMTKALLKKMEILLSRQDFFLLSLRIFLLRPEIFLSTRDFFRFISRIFRSMVRLFSLPIIDTLK